MTDARDVAAVAAAVAVTPAAHAGRTYWPTGPELLTYEDVAATLTELLGRPIHYRQVTPAEHRTAMIAAGRAGSRRQLQRPGLWAHRRGRRRVDHRRRENA